MTTTKPKQMTEEQRERIRNTPGVIHHHNPNPEPFAQEWVPPFTTSGYIDTLELIGRRDRDDDNDDGPIDTLALFGRYHDDDWSEHDDALQATPQ